MTQKKGAKYYVPGLGKCFFVLPDEIDLTGLSTALYSQAELLLLKKAMSGDIVFKCTPTTTTRAATAAAFTRNVVITLETAAGEVHTWFNGDITVSIADTSSAGTATITDTTPTMVNGSCTVVVSGDAAAWLAGTAQVETATCAGTVTTAGNVNVTVTAAGMTGSPKTIAVALAEADGANEIATKIRAALTADTAVTALYNVSGATDKAILTRKIKAANDATLNIAIADGTCVGVTTAATSANTTAGVAADTNTLTATQATILGYTVAAKTSVETII